MHRRAYLHVAGVATAGVTTGCLGTVLGGAENPTVLAPPEDRQYESTELPYPAYGQEFPRVRLPDPIAGTDIDTEQLDETLVVTAFFASCPVECALLVSRLARVQQGTIQAGLTDAVTFLAITFDPERDDADALASYAEKMDVSLAADNWQFLRPADAEQAKRVVHERLGITYDRVGADRSDRLPGYDFRHLSLTFLVNPENVVERAYRTEAPDHKRVLSDVKTVSNADW